MNPVNRNAFTLVELSIVLVILGLLTGGILTGQSLIRAAELRSITTEFQRYSTAVQTFRDKYRALPGDMKSASSFWGAADAGDATGADCKAVESTAATTCNGDGDGMIDEPTPTGNEMFRLWQHLANAGLVEGSYTGAGVGGVEWQGGINVNVPASKVDHGEWAIMWWDWSTQPTYAALYRFNYRNSLWLGGAETNNVSAARIIKPEEAWNIDSKMDDGKPGRGKVMIQWWDTCTTAAAYTDFDADYDLTDQTKACALAFPNVF